MVGGWFYIMVNRKNGTIYVGSTRDLAARNYEHKTKANPNSFTAKHGCDRLVYYEAFDTLMEAVARENAVKRWKRAWKIALIEADNPDWFDLKLNPLDFS
ncbi:GIY-YIG nuclease family protein [Algimonas porphyrae]|uniref:Nuclease n=1 Tax=Algimonas porphyrae TaxID=1128113 RepID=A0ABQ5UXS0_9PROT|nr:GIY-YIG nuclease family protein [Algimonas porphyrae]GLQ19199.1 nuclease [Algimonas porphyrae]